VAPGSLGRRRRRWPTGTVGHSQRGWVAGCVSGRGMAVPNMWWCNGSSGMVQREQWHDAPEAAGGAAAVVMESDLDAAGCIWPSR
jgi:hypothetical protein